MYFTVEEFFPPEIVKELGQKAWSLMDIRMLNSAHDLRTQFGPMVINNWHTGGEYTQRGFRPAGTETGAKWSQHKFGRALDAHFTQVSVEEVRQYILAHPKEFPGITCIEMGVSWLHIDCRNHNLPQQIMRIQP